MASQLTEIRTVLSVKYQSTIQAIDMAIYRKIDVSFWQDDFIMNLTPEEKFFYIYLMTNTKTSQCGIYELSQRVICFETGYNQETVEKLIKRFVDYGKIFYDDDTKEVMIRNWIKFNWSDSPKVTSRVEKELKGLKNQRFISEYATLAKQYGYIIDTESQEEETYKEKEEEEETQKEVIPYADIIGHLNQICDTSFKANAETHKKHIRARWNEGYRLNDFHAVVDKKVKEWKHSDLAKYLRPSTLFGTKFDEYLNQVTPLDKSKQQIAERLSGTLETLGRMDDDE